MRTFLLTGHEIIYLYEMHVSGRGVRRTVSYLMCTMMPLPPLFGAWSRMAL